ncbi:amidohydrolase [Saccharopolyspora sp. SCSIO 74807]|uniref:amidohydrolase n=1 Tax=Saccharopolyspora sp. SCSIO 74807 TaxID=3118084 RepID=UPI0030CF690B
MSDLESRYVDLHRNPELSFEEHRTAGIGAEALRAAGCEVTTGIGRTGVAGVLRNGAGPTVLLRADMDALPVREETGLSYASTRVATNSQGIEVPVAHACGHDMHVTWLLGAAESLAARRDSWSGTILFVLQPAEEAGGGARAMVEDGLFDRFGTPDVALGQHLAPMPAGHVLTRSGLAMSASDTLHVRLFGRGGHGSRPEATVDPVVLAASTVLRLQTVVSREIGATDAAVVTVGAMNAGAKENVIPDEAELQLSIRSFAEPVREKVNEAVRRIVRAESTASAAPREPEITATASYPPTVNDEAATEALTARFREEFGPDQVHDGPLITGSEDFGEFGRAAGVPSVFWFVGGIDPARFAADGTLAPGPDVPSNHSAQFAPTLHPTIDSGVRTLVTAALSYLSN